MDPEYISQLITENVRYNSGLEWYTIYEDLEEQLPYLIKQLTNKLGEQKATETIQNLAQLDPTNKKSYIGTYIKWLNDGTFRYPEDNIKLKQTIQDYEQLKNKHPLPKINKFKSLQDLTHLIDQHLRPQTLKQEKRKIKITNLEQYGNIIYNDGELAVIEITDPNSAVTLSSGTKWCTSDKKTAKEYLDKGPLYIIYKDGKKFAQAHLQSGQYMNLRDESLDNNIVQDIMTKSGLIKKIKEDPIAAFNYAYEIIQDRFPEAEPVIMKDPIAAYSYAHEIIGERWPEAEPTIMRDQAIASEYAFVIIRGRWPEAEPIIMKDPITASEYASQIIKGRWPEAEPIIMRDPVAASIYARHVIKGRWPEAEPTIMRDSVAASIYRTIEQI